MSTFTTPAPITRADSFLCVDRNERFSISPVLCDYLTKQNKTYSGMLCPRCRAWMLVCKVRTACKHIFCGICHSVSLLSCVVCDDSKKASPPTTSSLLSDQKQCHQLMVTALGFILSQRPLNKEQATVYDRFRFIQRLFDVYPKELDYTYPECYGDTDKKQLDHLMSDIREFQLDPTTVLNESKLYICLPLKLRSAFDKHSTTVSTLTVLRTNEQPSQKKWQKLTIVLLFPKFLAKSEFSGQGVLFISDIF